MLLLGFKELNSVVIYMIIITMFRTDSPLRHLNYPGPEQSLVFILFNYWSHNSKKTNPISFIDSVP
jgi:hypothetical protein